MISLGAFQFFCVRNVVEKSLQIIGRGMDMIQSTKSSVCSWMNEANEFLKGRIFYDRVCYFATYSNGRYIEVYNYDSCLKAVMSTFSWSTRGMLLPCSYLSCLPSYNTYIVHHYKDGIRHQDLYVGGKLPTSDEGPPDIPYLYATVNDEVDVLPYLVPWWNRWKELCIKDVLRILQGYHKLSLQDACTLTVLNKETMEEQVFKAEEYLLP